MIDPRWTSQTVDWYPGEMENRMMFIEIDQLMTFSIRRKWQKIKPETETNNTRWLVQKLRYLSDRRWKIMYVILKKDFPFPYY